MSETATQEKICHVGGVPSDKVHLVWGRVEPILKTVITPETGYDMDAVYFKLLNGLWQLWVVDDFKGVVITEIRVLPLFKILHASWLAGSDLKDWLRPAEQELEKFARHHDCERIVMEGRRGFRAYENKFPDYQPATTVYIKRLD